MFTTELQSIDLSKNEAIIYETLVDQGELSVADIARESGVNRRNVYDSLDRLIEKGLVFELRSSSEKVIKAVNPKKLRELLERKQQKLDAVIPELERLYRETPHEEEVYIYKGLEGWRNYLQQILDVGEDVYTLGGKGVFADEKISTFVEYFMQELEKKNITNRILFDQLVKEENRPILNMYQEENYRFLPEMVNTPSTIDTFGDYVVVFSELSSSEIDENSSFTVIKNKPVADSFRAWFEMLWQMVGEDEE